MIKDGRHRRNLAYSRGGGACKVDLGIRNFNSRKNRFGKMGKIRLNLFLIHSDFMTLGKEHREFTVPLFLCKWVTQVSLFCVP